MLAERATGRICRLDGIGAFGEIAPLPKVEWEGLIGLRIGRTWREITIVTRLIELPVRETNQLGPFETRAIPTLPAVQGVRGIFVKEEPIGSAGVFYGDSPALGRARDSEGG